ncbi:hypothetical protein TRIUR3_01007 [Triticum urartu]|uniref:Uncharacterized protein n=1 Tax=Triticum urartu TaxID=4572 RepID=M7ZHU6_TRIUA|nr:hypothetical protein TRIUR3_01007 [Triticum urartu]
MVRSPAASTPTPRSPAAPNPNSRSQAAPTPTPRSQAAPTLTPSLPAADLEEPKVTNELLRAIKIEKANDPDLEEHKGAGLAVRHAPSPSSPPSITRAELIAGTTVGLEKIHQKSAPLPPYIKEQGEEAADQGVARQGESYSHRE